MPVEHETIPQRLSPVQIITAALQRAAQSRATCPPDEDRSSLSSRLPPALAAEEEGTDVAVDRPHEVTIQPLTLLERPLSANLRSSPRSGSIIAAQEEQTSDAPDFGAAYGEVKPAPEEAPRSTPSPVTMSTIPPSVYYMEPALAKPLPKYSSSFLRPGTRFVGTQQSDRQQYKVQVDVKHVDMAESYLCGYLRIEGRDSVQNFIWQLPYLPESGLTADHPTLTTYFEGQIIGPKYTFKTKESDWGSTETVDYQHWNRFPAWKPLSQEARRPNFNYKDYAEREHLFMRWKEYFLVPDHKVKAISGASFEGFYYICFNQITGAVSGIYYHSKSEKYQQLELEHVPDKGCMPSIDFR